MKMKSQLTIAALLFAGLLASGCSQQQAAGEQTAQQAAAPAAEAPKAPAAAPKAPAAPKGPVVPKVKAKGKFKGAVKQGAAEAAAMKQYKK